MNNTTKHNKRIVDMNNSTEHRYHYIREKVRLQQWLEELPKDLDELIDQDWDAESSAKIDLWLASAENLTEESQNA